MSPACWTGRAGCLVACVRPCVREWGEMSCGNCQTRSQNNTLQLVELAVVVASY